MKYVLIATTLTTVHFAATLHANAQAFLQDNEPPAAALIMNDGLNAGDIMRTDLSQPVFPGTAPVSPSVGLSALGCDYGIEPYIYVWNAIYDDTNFLSSTIQDQTYFYNSLSWSSFTLRASDNGSGIKRIVVSLHERDVVHSTSNPLAVYDDGPTEFAYFSPSGASTAFQPIWAQGGNFSHYEKQLILEPRMTRIRQDKVLDFTLTTFGSTGRIDVLVEDRAGNTAEGSVYLADRWACL